MMGLNLSVWLYIISSRPLLLFFNTPFPLFFSPSILILIDINKTKWLMAAKPNKVPFDVGIWQAHISVAIGNYREKKKEKWTRKKTYKIKISQNTNNQIRVGNYWIIDVRLGKMYHRLQHCYNATPTAISLHLIFLLPLLISRFVPRAIIKQVIIIITLKCTRCFFTAVLTVAFPRDQQMVNISNILVHFWTFFLYFLLVIHSYGLLKVTFGNIFWDWSKNANYDCSYQHFVQLYLSALTRCRYFLKWSISKFLILTFSFTFIHCLLYILLKYIHIILNIYFR